MPDLFRGVDRGAGKGMRSQLGGNSAGKMLGRKNQEGTDRSTGLPAVSGENTFPLQAGILKTVPSPRLPLMPRHPGTRYAAH